MTDLDRTGVPPSRPVSDAPDRLAAPLGAVGTEVWVKHENHRRGLGHEPGGGRGPGSGQGMVPIGMGSGVCVMVAVRDALGVRTRIVGVVAERAPAYALSFERGEPVTTESADTFADGIATRSPDPQALAVIRRGVDRVVRVPDEAIRSAMRDYFTDTHQIAEGAAAAG